MTGNCVRWYKRSLLDFIIRWCGERDLRRFVKILSLLEGEKGKPVERQGRKAASPQWMVGLPPGGLLMIALRRSPAEEQFCLEVM